MAFESFRKKYDQLMNDKQPLGETDPEFVEMFSRFAYDEVVNDPGAAHPDLDDRTRSMAILAALLGCQGLDEYRLMLPAALKAGVTPVEIKEIVYQATAYLGIGRVMGFLNATNDVFLEEKIPLPVEQQGTTGPGTRMEAGERAQIEIFGEHMRGFADAGPEETRHIHRWLVGNCFGDYYTRGGLDARRREIITLCFLAAQGGCESQLVAHAKGNMNVGNEKAFLIAVVSQTMPYIGYPRTLNALSCIDKAAE
ncbi:carboxymuconolactone decarboxylase [Bifidobacterium primatium]|uniref:Carboxymuconolactone decarboxylase n=1 Tax=Bifidobacterium primatium TaxID=2045438 RepID=A0A2M9H710_9BIFI|nr:carboxymuconolactone decarboxylase family protein [Bifidobacterium primatium]PJM72610.1 carboxymuconolactone decarboxylase [Bifidobacterium primatium]